MNSFFKTIGMVAVFLVTTMALGREQPTFMDRLYTEDSFGYTGSRHFDGINGALRVGWCLTRRHHFELEADLFYLHCNGFSRQGGLIYSTGGNYVGYIQQHRLVEVFMIPVMANYRYILHFGKKGWASKILAYGGFGIGINFVQWSDQYRSAQYLSNGQYMGGFAKNYDESKIEFASQIFVGMGYQPTERWAFNAGFRLFDTQRFSFGGQQYPLNSGILTPRMRPMRVYWVAELGVHYGF